MCYTGLHVCVFASLSSRVAVTVICLGGPLLYMQTEWGSQGGSLEMEMSVRTDLWRFWRISRVPHHRCLKIIR